MVSKEEGMTREEALQNLNLPFDADREAVEAAYQRLVRRYPPEFHPEKFRAIDDSYRYLVSLPAMVQQLLAPAVESEKLDPSLLIFDLLAPADSCLEAALVEIRSIFLAETLWTPSPSAASGSRHS